MKIDVSTFQGEAPRIAPELLPDNAAQVAENCRLMSGNLEAWQDLAEQAGIVKTPNVISAYLMAGEYWLHWTESELDYDIGAVDVARGPIEGDTNEFTIFTGSHVPRWTNIELATTEPPPDGVSAGAYPYISYRLGVPEPPGSPTLAVSQSEAEGSVSITNSGAEEGGGSITGWTVDTGDLDTHDDNDVAGLEAYEGGFYFYGGAAAATTEAYQDINLADAGLSESRFLTLTWRQATGLNGSTGYMSMEFYDATNTLLATEAGLDVAGGLLEWTERSVSRLVEPNTEYVRLVMHFTRVGAGENDCYIDGISLDSSDATFNFDGSGGFTGWTNSGWVINTDASRGRPQPSFHTDNPGGGVNYMYRLVGSQDSPRIEMNADVYLVQNEARARLGFLLFSTSSGQGSGIELQRNTANVIARSYSSWTTQGGSLIATLNTDNDDEELKNKWLRLNIIAERNSATSATLTVNVYGLDNGVIYLADGVVDIAIDGDYFGMRWDSGDSANQSYVDNLSISVAAPDPSADDDEDLILTNYVFTFVNSIGQEGPPSDVSRDIQFNEGTVVTITTPTTADDDFDITHKRIYRAVTGTDGTTVYRLVVELPLATATHEDDVEDDGLEDDILITTDWDLPPVDGQNVLSLPNGITLLTAKNIVCPSVVNYAHAYPEAYRLLTESDIVAAGAIDTSVVLATQTRPYMLLGSNPESMSMSKFEQPQGCVAKRSLVSVRNYGIIYASPDGLVAITGPGNLQLLTEGYFTRREWQSQVVPDSIVAVAHDDRYFGTCNGQDSTGRSFIFDPRAGGNGWTWLDFTWQAAYSDPETDNLYFVINNELFLWEGNDVSRRPYTWRSKLHLFGRGVAFQVAQVEADNYDDLVLKVYSKGVLYQTKTITSDREFTLKQKATREFEFELTGTERVRSVTLAESIEELIGGQP